MTTVTLYRYWKAERGQLFSPLAGDPLPDGGTLYAGCHRPHLPPNPTCNCGVSAYRTAADVRRALDTFGLDPEQFVVTTGTADRRTAIADQKQQTYVVDGIPKIGPPAVRVRAFTVNAIFTDHPHTFAYSVPVHPMGSLA